MAARPGGVTLVAVLVWIQGLLTIVGGIFLLLAPSLIGGIITLIIGIVTIAVGAALLRGSNGARIVTTIVLLLSLIDAIYLLFASPGTIVSSGFSAALALIGIFLLYTKRANEYFGTN